MRSELLFVPYCFTLLWYGLYFSVKDFWNNLGDKPNWGNNEALFIVLYITYTFLFFIAIYISYQEFKKDYILLLLYLFIILILSIPYLMSFKNSNYETFVFYVLLFVVTISSLFVLKNNTIRDKINIGVILALSLYLLVWFINMKDIKDSN